MSRHSLCSTVSRRFRYDVHVRMFVSSGSGLFNSLFTCLGAFVGVFVYYTFLDRSLSRQELDKSCLVLQSLPTRFGLNRLSLHIILSLLFLSISFILEVFLPYRRDLIDLDSRLIRTSWSPFWCGVGVGSLQLFVMLLLEKSLGVSTGFSVLLGQLTRWKSFEKICPSLKSFRDGLSNYLTLLFTIGIVCGSFISTCQAVGYPLQQDYGTGKWSSFFGGFLLLIGARCAGGCTSGQGISGEIHFSLFFLLPVCDTDELGLSHLLIGSSLATAAMFAGGISSAILYVSISNDWSFSRL